MPTSCSSSFIKLPGRSVRKLVDVNSKYLYLVSSLVFIILLKMGVRVVYTFKYEIYISCTWTLKHTFHWILQPCITGQTSQRPFDWSVPPMMSGSCSGIREGYVGASRSNVQHLPPQPGWMTLCAPGAFCSLLRWFRTGAHMTVPRTFSPGV